MKYRENCTSLGAAFKSLGARRRPQALKGEDLRRVGPAVAASDVSRLLEEREDRRREQTPLDRMRASWTGSRRAPSIFFSLLQPHLERQD